MAPAPAAFCHSLRQKTGFRKNFHQTPQIISQTGKKITRMAKDHAIPGP